MAPFSHRIATLSAAAALAFGLSAHAESVRVPGTGVRLAPPPGFSRAGSFAGFQDPEHGASILITEIPGPVSQIRRGMTLEGLSSRGMHLIESNTVTVSGDEALLLHVSQRADGTDFFKWILVGGSEARTFMIVGTYPETDAELSDGIRASLLTASWNEEGRRGLFEGLSFRIDPAPRMRLAERMANLLILTESGRLDSGDPGAGVLIVGSSLGEVPVGDLVVFAKERLMKTDRLKAVRFRSDSAVVVDGLEGRELIAEAADAKTGRPVGVYQLLLADGTTYYIAQGFVLKSRLKEMLPVFRSVTGSFHRVAPARPVITQ